MFDEDILFRNIFCIFRGRTKCEIFAKPFPLFLLETPCKMLADFWCKGGGYQNLVFTYFLKFKFRLNKSFFSEIKKCLLTILAPLIFPGSGTSLNYVGGAAPLSHSFSQSSLRQGHHVTKRCENWWSSLFKL